MALDSIPANIFTSPQSGGSSDGFGGSGFLMGLLLSRSGMFGNQDNASNAVTTASVNQAAHDAASMVIATQNQAQAIQDINRVAVDVKDTQAALQHDISANAGQINTNVLQGQIAAMQGQANIINAIDSHTNDIANEISRANASIGTQFAAVNAAIATTGAAAAIASKDAVIEGMRNTQAIIKAVEDQGEKTREQQSAFYVSDLQGRLSDAKNQVTELTLDGNSNRRARDLELNINQNVNQTQSTAVAQNQNLMILTALNQLLGQQTAQASNFNILGNQRGINQTPVNVGG